MAHSDQRPAGTNYGFPADPRGFLFPAILWALYFVASYSIQGAGCALGWDRPALLGLDVIQVTLLTFTSLVLALLLAIGIWSWRALRSIARTPPDPGADIHVRQARFLAAGAGLNAGLFFVATLWIGVPALWSQSCGALS